MNKSNEGALSPHVPVARQFVFPSFLTLILIFLISSCQPDEDFIPEPDGSTPVVLSEGAAVFQTMLTDINELRAAGCRCGNSNMPPVGPLQWNDQIATAAAEHSADMVHAGRLDHAGTDGSTAGDRLTRNGYEWRSYGENIASGFTSMDAVLQAWIDSPGHCRNLMKSDFTEIGIARKNNYWTQVFARPF